jgi:uncharacterized membrane protein
MSLRFRRLSIAAPVAEVVAVAMLTALLPALLASGGGTLVYQIMAAQRLALWVGPLGGFLVCALAGWWVARLARDDAERNGLALGVIVAVLDLALLTVGGAPFGALMVLSAIGRIAGGYAGGWWAGRRLSAMTVPLASRTP